jgi:hypothetical protein
MEKKPRHYALDYIKAGEKRENQKQALAGCSVEWQDLVRTHIKIMRQQLCKTQSN